jgi:hypothetical protein
MKQFKILNRSWLVSIFALSMCALVCDATGMGRTASVSSKPFDGSCVAAGVSELEVSNDGLAHGTLSVRNRCQVGVVLLLSPVRVDLVRRGQRIPWMGAENGRNAFARMLLLQNGVEIDRVFAGDAAQNVYAPLKGVSVGAGSAVSIPIVGRLPARESMGVKAKGQLLLPCFPEPSAISRTAALDVGNRVGQASGTGSEQPRRLVDAATLVHTSLFPVRIESSK